MQTDFDFDDQELVDAYKAEHKFSQEIDALVQRAEQDRAKRKHKKEAQFKAVILLTLLLAVLAIFIAATAYQFSQPYYSQWAGQDTSQPIHTDKIQVDIEPSPTRRS